MSRSSLLASPLGSPACVGLCLPLCNISSLCFLHGPRQSLSGSISNWWLCSGRNHSHSDTHSNQLYQRGVRAIYMSLGVYISDVNVDHDCTDIVLCTAIHIYYIVVVKLWSIFIALYTCMVLSHTTNTHLHAQLSQCWLWQWVGELDTSSIPTATSKHLQLSRQMDCRYVCVIPSFSS